MSMFSVLISSGKLLGLIILLMCSVPVLLTSVMLICPLPILTFCILIACVISSTIRHHLLSNHSKNKVHKLAQAIHINRRRYRKFTRRKALRPQNIPIALFMIFHSSIGTAYGSSSFRGGIIDTGAAKSCIGIDQAQAYCTERAIDLKASLRPTNTHMSFGNQQAKSIGVLPIWLTSPRGYVQIDATVVQQKVPLLIGMDSMDVHGWYLRNSRNVFCSEFGWTLPVFRARGHAWLSPIYFKGGKIPEGEREILYTRQELRKLHSSFRHPSPGKLISLLRSTSMHKLPAETLAVIQQSSDDCRICQRFKRKEISFGRKLQGQAIFNRKVVIDIMYLDSRPVLHCIDKDTRCGAATFIWSKTRNPTTSEVWNAFCICWAYTYHGMPDILATDRGSNLTSEEFLLQLSEHSVEHHVSGVESHHSMGTIERAHHPLRITYHKIREHHSSITPESALQMARKAMNDLRGPSGFPPTMLVFGMMPRDKSAGLNAKLLKNSERFKAMMTARKENTRVLNDSIIKRMLKERISPSCDRRVSIGEKLFVFREKTSNRKAGYDGPFTVQQVSADDQIRLDCANSTSKWFSADQCKPVSNMAGMFMNDIRESKMSFCLTPDKYSAQAPQERVENIFHEATVLEEILYTSESSEVLATEVIKNNDARARSPEFLAAKQKELRDLIARGTFKVVLRKDIAEKPLKGRFVLTLKSKET